MKTTVFGHTGFIGSHFVSRWKDTDTFYLPERYSRRPNSECDNIINFISTTHNYNVFDDPTIDVKTNLVILTEMLESWKNNRPEATFNLISSWFVYGPQPEKQYMEIGMDPGGVSEDATCYPQGFYSITKRCAEQLVISFAETFGLKYRILRLSNVIGPGDRGVSKQKNALQYLIGEVVGNRPIELYNDGEFYRNYLDVEDCVEAIRLVMEKGKLNEIYNIGKMPPDLFGDLIDYVHAKTKSMSPVRTIPAKDFHRQVQVKDFNMDCWKLYELGFEPKYTTEQSIDRILWVDYGIG